MDGFTTKVVVQWFAEGVYDNHYWTIRVPNLTGCVIIASFALTLAELIQKGRRLK